MKLFAWGFYFGKNVAEAIQLIVAKQSKTNGKVTQVH